MQVRLSHHRLHPVALHEELQTVAAAPTEEMLKLVREVRVEGLEEEAMDGEEEVQQAQEMQLAELLLL
jgi:hypothetical protein